MDRYIKNKLSELVEPAETFVLPRESARDVRFEGWLLADASPLGEKSYVEQNGRLYLTKSGKLVFWLRETILSTEVPQNVYTVHISQSVEELIETAGTCWLAKQVYEEAGVDCIEDIC